jgi:hypothetical protein
MEMPRLAVGPQEATRLFGLTSAACAVVMDDLVRRGLLGQEAKDRYVQILKSPEARPAAPSRGRLTVH